MVSKLQEDLVKVRVEIPQGSFNKFEVDENGEMKLDRVLAGPMPFPAFIEYGSIEKTLAEDNDPLDVLCLTSYPTFPGCIIEKSKIIGILLMIDGGEKDYKLLTVNTKDPFFRNIDSLEKVNQTILDKISYFFSKYKDLEKGKVIIKGWSNKEEALKFYKECKDNYMKKAKK